MLLRKSYYEAVKTVWRKLSTLWVFGVPDQSSLDKFIQLPGYWLHFTACLIWKRSSGIYTESCGQWTVCISVCIYLIWSWNEWECALQFHSLVFLMGVQCILACPRRIFVSVRNHIFFGHLLNHWQNFIKLMPGLVLYKVMI